MSSGNNKSLLKKPSEESTLQNIYNTKKALEKLSNHRIKTYQSFKTNNLNTDANKNNQLCYKYINYQFDSNKDNTNSNKNSHLIKLVALPVGRSFIQFKIQASQNSFIKHQRKKFRTRIALSSLPSPSRRTKKMENSSLCQHVQQSKRISNSFRYTSSK